MATELLAVDECQSHGDDNDHPDNDHEQVRFHLESIPEMKNPFLWAHRGDSASAPENTMAAFVAALESGADGIELDVHLSSDGVPVVIHDETLNRTTDAAGLVSLATTQQLSTLDAGSWFSPDFAGEQIPLLAEVLGTFAGRLRMNLEIKEYDAGMTVLEQLKSCPAADVVVSSFDYEVLQQLRRADPVLPIGVLYQEGNWRRAVRLARALSASSFHPVAYAVHRPMLAECRRAGLQVHVWTVDSVSAARRLVRAGVTGIFTNTPEALRKAFSGPGHNR